MSMKITAISSGIVSVLSAIGLIKATGYYPVAHKTCERKMEAGNQRFNSIEKNLKKLNIIEQLLLVMATSEQKEQAKQNSELFKEE